MKTAEYILKELEAMGRFHKYRQLKQRYEEPEREAYKALESRVEQILQSKKEA